MKPNNFSLALSALLFLCAPEAFGSIKKIFPGVDNVPPSYRECRKAISNGIKIEGKENAVNYFFHNDRIYTVNVGPHGLACRRSEELD